MSVKMQDDQKKAFENRYLNQVDLVQTVASFPFMKAELSDSRRSCHQ